MQHWELPLPCTQAQAGRVTKQAEYFCQHCKNRATSNAWAPRCSIGSAWARRPDGGNHNMRVENKSVHEVLIVEDNRDAADSLAEFLRLNGFAVRVAYTGPTGLSAALSKPPDAVLCDINLPGLDGYGVARQIRAASPNQPILVAVTACREQDLVRPAAESGFDHYFLKPADPVEICGYLCDHAAGAGLPPARHNH